MRFFVLVTTFLLLGVKLQDPKGLTWNERELLNWEWYKGKAPINATWLAMTVSGIEYNYRFNLDTAIVTIESYFYPQESWVIGGKGSEGLLLHERGHFNITEIYSRKLRKELSGLKCSVNSVGPQIKELFESTYAQMRIEQKLYDSETKHNRNRDAQVKWDLKISEDLKELEQYKNPEVRILLK